MPQVFTGCSPSVAEHCQLALSVVGDQILNRGVMTVIAVGLTSTHCFLLGYQRFVASDINLWPGVASMVRVFGSERVVYWREASGLSQPSHTFAYFIGKDVSMLPQVLSLYEALQRYIK